MTESILSHNPPICETQNQDATHHQGSQATGRRNTRVLCDGEGATVVITHRVRKDKHDEYEQWLGEIAPIGQSYPGHIDWQVIRAISGLTETYTIISRYDTHENLNYWINSPVRKRLIEKVQPLLISGDDFYISSGLDFWFTPEGAKAQVPVRWKQFLVTWSVIFPMVSFMPSLITPVLHKLGLPDHHLLNTFFLTGIIVFLVVYFIMPHYTKLIHKWLFR